MEFQIAESYQHKDKSYSRQGVFCLSGLSGNFHTTSRKADQPTRRQGWSGSAEKQTTVGQQVQQEEKEIVQDLSGFALKVDSDVQQQAHSVNMPGLSLILYSHVIGYK